MFHIVNCNIESLEALIDNRQIWLTPRLLKQLFTVSLCIAQLLHDIPIGLLPGHILAFFLISLYFLNVVFESHHPLIQPSLALSLSLRRHPGELTQAPC
jgi:hypothetical protein